MHSGYLCKMSPIRYLFAVMMILGLMVSSSSAEAKRFDAAYLTKSSIQLGYKDGRLALSMWVKEITAQEKMAVDVMFYDSEHEVMDVYMASKVAMAGVHPYYYLNRYKQYDVSTSNYWMAQRNEGRFEKMIILVRSDRGIHTLSDLKGKHVMSREDDLLGRMYLEKLLLDERQIDSESFLKGMSMSNKYSTAILKTFFGKTDASIVPEYTYKTACELNPALAKELKVLRESERIFPPVLLLIRKGTDRDSYMAFERSVIRLNTSVRGENIRALFKMRALIELPAEALEPIRRFYDEYMASKQQYRMGR